MLYMVSLMPLVERGRYLRCVLSYVFLSELISDSPDIGSFLEIKVGKSTDYDFSIHSYCYSKT